MQRHLGAGFSLASRVPTQGRDFRFAKPFESDIESTSSDSSETSSASQSEASFIMDDFHDLEAQTQSQSYDHVGRLKFDIRLKYIRYNQYGAKLYIDPLGRLTVKIEDVPSPFEPEVWVNYQSDRYMSIQGTKFMLTPRFEFMDPTGVTHCALKGGATLTPNLAEIPQGLYMD